MYELNYGIMFLVAAFTGIIVYFSHRFVPEPKERTFLIVGIIGTWLICGFGSAYEGVPVLYIFFYIVYLSVLVVSFVLGIYIFKLPLNKVLPKIIPAVYMFTRKKLFLHWALAIYFITWVLMLVYPENRIFLLLKPPRPDISFFTGLPPERDLFDFLVQYVQRLAFPLYLIALSNYRKRYVSLAALLMLPNYLTLCATGYVGRGDFIVTIISYFLILWIDNPRRRILICFLSIIVIVPFSYFLYIYGYMRGGLEYLVIGAPFITSIQDLFYEQTSFPLLFEKVLHSGQHIDLLNYLKWILTLPLPKLIFGEISGSRINIEITQIISGIYPGMPGFSVILTGVITESIYIYGETLFWIHPLSIGLLFALLCQLTSKIPSFIVLNVYFMLFFSYILPRAGIAGALPTLINNFLSFYALLTILVVSRSQRHNNIFPGTKGPKYHI